MKIIKTGTVPSERVWRGECRNCGSVVEAREGELKHITHDQREAISFSWEICPVCKAGSESGYGGVLFYPIFKRLSNE